MMIPWYGEIKYEGFKAAEPPPDNTTDCALPPTIASFFNFVG